MFWRLISTALLTLVFLVNNAEAAKKHTKVVKPVAATKAAKPNAPTAEVCLARLILGEAGAEPLKGQKAVAYVAVMYAKKMSRRSVCAEVYDSGRYSWTLSKLNRLTVAKTVGEPWKHAKKIAAEMIRKPLPPHPTLKYATTYYVPSESSDGGKQWILQNTYPLDIAAASDFQIGNHVFREERVHANSRGVIYPRQKPARDGSKKLIAFRAMRAPAP